MGRRRASHRGNPREQRRRGGRLPRHAHGRQLRHAQEVEEEAHAPSPTQAQKDATARPVKSKRAENNKYILYACIAGEGGFLHAIKKKKGDLGLFLLRFLPIMMIAM